MTTVADNEIPGVALPASPVAGTLAAGTDLGDVYSLHLDAGQKLSVSLNGTDGRNCDALLFAPDKTAVWHDAATAGAYGDAYPDQFTFTAPAAGTYYLHVFERSRGTASYSLTWSRDGEPVDTTPPTTTATGLGAAWRRGPVTIELTADDGSGSGVARIEYRLGDGAWATYGAPISLNAEGETAVGYRAVDNAGMVEVAKSGMARIDRTGPRTAATNTLKVKKNRRATFRFTIADRTATARVTIRIFKGKTLKRSLAVGRRPCGSAQRYSWMKCALGKGVYTWLVSAVDEAGNPQEKAGRKRLTVE